MLKVIVKALGLSAWIAVKVIVLAALLIIGTTARILWWAVCSLVKVLILGVVVRHAVRSARR